MTRSRYTDIDNIGVPVVPLLSSRENGPANATIPSPELINEVVWVHDPD